jgi:restriction endonuclease Mrr
LVGMILLTMHFGKTYWRRRQIQVKADSARKVEDLLDLSPTEFEKMVVELYTAMGHRARRIGSTGDHGVDVVVQAKNGEKWVVQCKRWRGNVGEPVIRDFYGMMHHEKADRGAIITTGTFTRQAKSWAKGKPITLLEGDKFLYYLKLARAKSS